MLELIDGLAWVVGCKHNIPRGRLSRLQRAQESAAWIAAFSRDRGTVVQAGGHIGLWPRALATWFDRVVTCEPDATNYAALVHNVAGYTNINHRLGAFGAEAGRTALVRDTPASGMWRCEGDGDVPVTTIDSLELTHVGALVLDVEGYELAALNGASDTIQRHTPAIWLEYLHHEQELSNWLHQRGYLGPLYTVGSDVVFLHV